MFPKYYKDFVIKTFSQVNLREKDLTTVLIHCTVTPEQIKSSVYVQEFENVEVLFTMCQLGMMGKNVTYHITGLCKSQ